MLNHMEIDRKSVNAQEVAARRSQDKSSLHPRVLVYSQRNVVPNVLFRCPHREFEDLICQMEPADLLAPKLENSRRYDIARRIAWHSPIVPNPGVPRVKVTKKYDLFFTVCGSPADLMTLNVVDNWTKLAKTSVCLVDELWMKELPDYKYPLKVLGKFDFVVLYYSQGVETISKAIGRPCVFLPPGIDSALFCPYPELPHRGVDVYSIGRRSEVTHRKLLQMAREKGTCYVYDSIAGNRALDSVEHRLLFANLAKRSRYFITNPALVDRPQKRGTQNEIGNRYFEGAAAGALMIGERPTNAEFTDLFGWPDALLHLPYDSPDIDAIMNESDSQPDRQETMRRNNVVQTLTRHDWAYRWEAVLRTVGLEPSQGLLERKDRLMRLAADITGLSGSSAGMGNEAGHLDASGERICSAPRG